MEFLKETVIEVGTFCSSSSLELKNFLCCPNRFDPARPYGEGEAGCRLSSEVKGQGQHQGLEVEQLNTFPQHLVLRGKHTSVI